jgi:hypothetical protein
MRARLPISVALLGVAAAASFATACSVLLGDDLEDTSVEDSARQDSAGSEAGEPLDSTKPDGSADTKDGAQETSPDASVDSSIDAVPDAPLDTRIESDAAKDADGGALDGADVSDVVVAIDGDAAEVADAVDGADAADAIDAIDAQDVMDAADVVDTIDAEGTTDTYDAATDTLADGDAPVDAASDAAADAASCPVVAGNLLSNGTFEAWEGTRPSNWYGLNGCTTNRGAPLTCTSAVELICPAGGTGLGQWFSLPTPLAPGQKMSARIHARWISGDRTRKPVLRLNVFEAGSEDERPPYNYGSFATWSTDDGVWHEGKLEFTNEGPKAIVFIQFWIIAGDKTIALDDAVLSYTP